MKECDKQNIRISSKILMIDISSNNDMVDTLLVKSSLHFTTLVDTSLLPI
jgi:hypothetical protein